jgi:hypothetical protein
MLRWAPAVLRTAGPWLALAALVGPAGAQPSAPAAPAPTEGRDRAPGGPRAYLLFLIDGRDPIIVERYVEEGDQIRFEKFGGWVGIPKYEVVRIVPDEPEPEPAGSTSPATGAGSAVPLYVTTRDGATIRASGVAAEGPRVRVSTPEGSLTFPRTDLVGVLRVPPGAGSPEAWITLIDDAGAVAGTTGPAAAGGGPPAPAAPYPVISDRPHLLQLAEGTVIQIDGFWIEDGQIRFRRLGGVVGFALGEIARLLPQEPAPADGRPAARFVRQLGADRLEVRMAHGLERVRLIGVEPLPGAPAAEDPWAALERGVVLHLEFDRQRYEGGDWLAYVYLPGGRMLNAELVRLGLARPRAEPHNVRYVDLLHEIWTNRRSTD